MSAKLRTHIRSNIIGYVALFFALSTGSAVALSGSNTVFTDDITDNQVYSADVRNDTLSGGGLAAADLKPGSVGTSEVVNNSLTGADVSEPSLGQVPSASNADTLDGVDSTGFLSTAGGQVVGDLGVDGTVSIGGPVNGGGLVVTGSGGISVGNGYIQFDAISGSAPDSSDCDEAGEAGRVIVRSDGATPTTLYICTAIGWVGK
jgi:hypothetical protein